MYESLGSNNDSSQGCKCLQKKVDERMAILSKAFKYMYVQES